MTPTKPKKMRQRARKAPVVVDLNDPKWADLRGQLADDTPVSEAEALAHMQWLRTGR